MNSNTCTRTCSRLQKAIATPNFQLRIPSSRPFSSTTPHASEVELSRTDLPRWRQTPKAMAMPYRLRPAPVKSFTVNESPEVLSQTYDRLLGAGGQSALPEEVKWLAVTHKSFDHGRQGSNDRLAFLGKRIVDMQTSLALLAMPRASAGEGGHVQGHPALAGLENVSAGMKEGVLDKRRVAGIARSNGLAEVMRWKPRKADRLQSSGIETVLVHTLYSIVGAISLQRGGSAATQFVRQKILGPLGLR